MEESEKTKQAKKRLNLKMDREFASGGVVFKKVKGKGLKVKVLWLIAKSSPSEFYPESYWRLPKGWLDDEEDGKKPGPLGSGDKRATEKDLKKAALREVKEEGGVKAKIISKLRTDRFFFTSSGKKMLKFVTYYLMEWISDLPEGPGIETSEVAWLPYDEARKRLKHSGEKKVLDKARQVLKAGVQESLV